MVMITGEICGPYPLSLFEYYDDEVEEVYDNKGKLISSRVKKKRHMYKECEETVRLVIDSPLSPLEIWEDIYADDAKPSDPPIERRQKFIVDVNHLFSANRPAWSYEKEATETTTFGTKKPDKKVRGKHTNVVAHSDLREVT